MKKLNYIVIFAAVVAATLVSCQKVAEIEAEKEVYVEVEKEGINVTLTTDAVTKTYIEGATPYWKSTDAVGVFTGTNTVNAKFTNTHADGQPAEFEGSVPEAGTYYAYYPHSINGANENGALIIVPQDQMPTPTSFDGAADLLLSQSFEISTTESTNINVKFRRLAAFLKVSFTDATTGTKLAGEYATAVSVQEDNGDNRIVGTFRLTTTGPSAISSGWKKVNATYPADTYEITNASHAAWFGILPQTFANGSTLIFTAETDNYIISKTVTLPSEVEVAAGSILPLSVSLGDVNVTKKVKLTKVWGNYGVAGTAGWPAYVAGAEDLDTKLRNACFDDDYVYIPKTDASSTGGSFNEASIFMFNLSDGSYAGKVQRTTDPDYMAGTWASTFPVSCARIMKNTDPTVNGGKDILICTNLCDGQNVRLYAWPNGTNNQPQALTNFTSGRRFGDRISVEGTYQEGRVWYRSYSGGMTAYINLVPGYTGGFNGSHAWNWVEALGATATSDGDAMTEYTSFNKGSYGIVASNTSNGTYLISGTDTEKSYPGYKRCFGWHAFKFDGVDYIAYLDMSGGTNLPIVTILEGESDTLEHLKATMNNKKVAARACIATSNQNDFTTTGVYATSNVGDCQVRFIGGVPYVLGMTRGGIALFKLELN